MNDLPAGWLQPQQPAKPVESIHHELTVPLDEEGQTYSFADDPRHEESQGCSGQDVITSLDNKLSRTISPASSQTDVYAG